MQKNTSGQKICFYAFTSTTNAPKTGDAVNITAYVSIDGGAVTVLADTSATEMDATNAPGMYIFDVAQAESNGNMLLFTAKSSTLNVFVQPVYLQTIPSCLAVAGGASGGVQICGSNAATTFASLTCTGNFAISDGVTVTRSTSGQDGITITGSTTGNGVTINGGSTGNGLKLVGGGTSGDGLIVTTTIGHGFNISGNGSNKHGAQISGGSSSTSDGVKCVAGNNGVGLRVDSLTCSNNALVGGTWTTTGTTTLTGAVSLGSTLGVTGTTTFTGNVGMAAGLSITQSSSNASALVVTGNGTGNGATLTSGNGLTGVGLSIVANSTNGAALNLAGKGTGAGILSTGGLTGNGIKIVGGGTSGDGLLVTTTSGHGINLAPVGTSKHGFFATGGNGGTSDGMNLVAGTGGVDLRANQTGNLTGNVSGSVGSVTGLTGATIATAIWQDTTAGDFTVSSSIGKSLFTGVAPGASGGLLWCGNNAQIAFTAGVFLTNSNTSGAGLSITGGASAGPGLEITGGVSDGSAVALIGGSGNGAGLEIDGNGTGGDILLGGDGRIHGTIDTLTTYTGNTVQTGDAYARLGAPAHTSIAGDIANVLTVGGAGPWTGGGSAPTVLQIDTQLSSTHGAGSWLTGGGSGGAFAITITVNDGTTALQNVKYGIYDGGGGLVGLGATDASGHGTISADAGTYTVALVKDGYTFTPTTRTVTGNQAGTLVNALSMTAITPPSPPSDPSMCRISGYLRNQRSGAMMAGVQLRATRLPNTSAYAGGILVGKVRSAVSDATGLVQLDVERNDYISPSGSTWHITCPDADIDFTQAFDTSTFLLSTLFP